VRTFEADIGTLVAGGNPPDIALFPQPGRLAGFANSGDAFAVPDDVVANVSENWSGDWMSFGNVGGTQFGIPLKSDVKSLVWYIPSVWEEKGYEVPTTLDEFFALTEEMAANGDTPLCVGIESGTATGWPFTDWVEDLILRNQGIDYYNQWATHEIPFNSPEVVETFQTVADLWNGEGMTYASTGNIVTANFNANAEPLVNGDCMMHRQASFFAANFEGIAELGTGPGQVSTFYFPANEGNPVLAGGLIAGAFRDSPEVWAVMQYLGSPEYTNNRQPAQTELAGGGISAFLSANLNADQSLFNEIEQGFLEILQNGSPVAFDASDNMPSEVQAAFWSGATSLINGDITAQEAADQAEAAWPAADAAPATTASG
jgi:alpha-glucoside transport system substrate-binding protein